MTDEFWSGKLLINDIYESLVSLALSEVLKRDQLSQRDGEVSATHRDDNITVVTKTQPDSHWRG